MTRTREAKGRYDLVYFLRQVHRTETNLDLLQEHTADDCWNVHNLDPRLDSRDSQSWTNLHPKDICGQEKDFTKKKTTSRPHDILPEVWSKMTQNCQREAWQQRDAEKTMLEGARRLIEIYYVTPMINERGKQKHEEHIADRGYKSLVFYSLVHLPIRIPKAVKIPEAKVAVRKEWDKLKNARRNRGGTQRRQNRSLCKADGLKPPQNSELDT